MLSCYCFPSGTSSVVYLQVRSILICNNMTPCGCVLWMAMSISISSAGCYIARGKSYGNDLLMLWKPRNKSTGKLLRQGLVCSGTQCLSPLVITTVFLVKGLAQYSTLLLCIRYSCSLWGQSSKKSRHKFILPIADWAVLLPLLCFLKHSIYVRAPSSVMSNVYTLSHLRWLHSNCDLWGYFIWWDLSGAPELMQTFSCSNVLAYNDFCEMAKLLGFPYTS